MESCWPDNLAARAPGGLGPRTPSMLVRLEVVDEEEEERGGGAACGRRCGRVGEEEEDDEDEAEVERMARRFREGGTGEEVELELWSLSSPSSWPFEVWAPLRRLEPY